MLAMFARASFVFFLFEVINFKVVITSKNVNVMENDIAFDLPDITMKMETAFGEAQIEAFKGTNNDQIIKDDKRNRVSELFWVSIGNPTLIKTSSLINGTVKSLFHFTPDGFYTVVEMLTTFQSKQLANVVSAKYNITIKPSQIVHLVLSQFECLIHLFDGDFRYILKGAVRDFRNFPLRLDFDAPKGTPERNLFKQLRDSDGVNLECSISSKTKKVMVNTLTITAEESQQLGIAEKLFGPAHTNSTAVYVTRQQMEKLSAEMYLTLEVVEEYQIPEFQFTESFVEEIIKQVSQGSHVQTVPVDKALDYLSRYGQDFSHDLHPNEIKRDLGKIFKLVSYENKSHIVLDERFSDALKESGENTNNYSGGGSVLKLFRVSGSMNSASEYSKDWMMHNKTIKDQLQNLNSNTRDEIEWTIEGNRIIPKNIKVAKILKAHFLKTLSFKRIRRQFTNSAFHMTLMLFSHRYGKAVEKLEEVFAQLSELRNKAPTFPTASIVVYTSTERPPFPWLICDGQAVSRTVYSNLFKVIGVTYGQGDGNSTFNLPDLRGRVVVGLDTTKLRVSGSTIVGQTGGNATQKLTVAELPAHVHTVESINVQTEGSHSHSIYDPGHNHGGSTGEFGIGDSASIVGIVHGIGTWQLTDRSEHAHSIPYGFTGINIQTNGEHTHRLSGTTNSAGSGAPFPILQPYQTFNYIIYTG